MARVLVEHLGETDPGRPAQARRLARLVRRFQRRGPALGLLLVLEVLVRPPREVGLRAPAVAIAEDCRHHASPSPWPAAPAGASAAAAPAAARRRTQALPTNAAHAPRITHLAPTCAAYQRRASCRGSKYRRPTPPPAASDASRRWRSSCRRWVARPSGHRPGPAGVTARVRARAAWGNCLQRFVEVILRSMSLTGTKGYRQRCFIAPGGPSPARRWRPWWASPARSRPHLRARRRREPHARLLSTLLSN